MNKPLTFDSVEAIHTGGSYVVGTDGKAVRDDRNSTSLESIAKGAPGPAAELNAAAVGVAPALPAAPAAAGKAPAKPAA